MKKWAKTLILIWLATFTTSIFAGGIESPKDRATAAPLYIAGTIGFGSTDWSMLVATEGSEAALVSPVDAKDTGFTGGVIVGYYFSPYFALEGTYVSFPTTTLTFANPTIYPIWADNWDGYDVIKTHSSAFGIYGKFIIPVKYIPHLHAFASAGLALVFRRDILTNNQLCHHPGGVFGVGLIYNFAYHIMSQIGFQFFTGYGKAATLPALDFFPFLWQVHFVLGYQIKL